MQQTGFLFPSAVWVVPRVSKQALFFLTKVNSIDKFDSTISSLINLSVYLLLGKPIVSALQQCVDHCTCHNQHRK